ncbi:MAG: DUF4342 domain-containing protein [Cellulosilyticaceae bacterium]
MENNNITLEQIDLLMDRAHVSYTDAKEALENANGDILDALLWLERNKKVNPEPKKEHDTMDRFGNFIDKLNKTRFKMHKGSTTYVNVSLTLALILIVFTLHISIIVLLLSLITGVRIELEGDNDLAEKVNASMDKIQK